ncbi:MULTISPECIES: hypothetical protein [Mycolicibacterium]|uniref:Uncharacterized protein n=2 Tax=Mycolicibacterium agri TaxID=36811 RepID=A0A7I9W1K0_MYCAG|nr:MULTISPECIES: hypothetical protein [Mycolicibacterium]GFG51562.1 hypothetical protein MAGR_30030 [Mycolicibacterium agri]
MTAGSASCRERKDAIDSAPTPPVGQWPMSVAAWIVIAVFAVGLIATGLVRMQDRLKKPVPPEVIEAARRERERDAEDEE